MYLYEYIYLCIYRFVRALKYILCVSVYICVCVYSFIFFVYVYTSLWKFTKPFFCLDVSEGHMKGALV